jgi:hypothetical protein
MKKAVAVLVLIGFGMKKSRCSFSSYWFWHEKNAVAFLVWGFLAPTTWDGFCMRVKKEGCFFFVSRPDPTRPDHVSPFLLS